MNPQPKISTADPEILDIHSSPVSPDVGGEGTDDAPDNPPAPTLGEGGSPLKTPPRRGNGKIAKLPKVLRDRINAMIDDGVPYPVIIQKLEQSTDPPMPYPLSVVNLSRWKDNGYQHHLAQQERLAAVQANREASLDLVAGDDTTTLPEANLQLIASHYYDILGDFPAAALKRKLAEDPLKYARFLNVFARLTREILNLKKHREACAKAVAAELKRLDPTREFTDREHEIITDRMDDYFLKPRRRRPNPDQPAAPPNPSNPVTSEH